MPIILTHKCFFYYCRKGVPNSPRILTTGPQPQGTLIATSMAPGTGTSPKGATGLIRQSISTGSSRPILQYGGALPEYAMTVQHQPPPVPPQHSNVVQAPPTSATIAPPTVGVSVAATPIVGGAATPPSAQTQAQTTVVQAIPMHESFRRYIVNGTSKFFGVNGKENNEKVWIERRRRLAIKLFGGVKDDFHVDGSSNGGHASGNTAYEDSLVRSMNYFSYILRSSQFDEITQLI